MKSRQSSDIASKVVPTESDETSGPLPDVLTQDLKLDCAMALAARLWLMISIDPPPRSLMPGRAVHWGDKDKLADTIKDQFFPGALLQDAIKLHKAFTAANLEKIAGIKVVGTSNLADHLAMTCDDTKVMIFHQVSFLELHRQSKG